MMADRHNRVNGALVSVSLHPDHQITALSNRDNRKCERQPSKRPGQKLCQTCFWQNKRFDTDAGLDPCCWMSNISWLAKFCVLYCGICSFGCFGKVVDSSQPFMTEIQLVNVTARCQQNVVYGSGYVSLACGGWELCAVINFDCHFKTEVFRT